MVQRGWTILLLGAPHRVAWRAFVPRRLMVSFALASVPLITGAAVATGFGLRAAFVSDAGARAPQLPTRRPPLERIEVDAVSSADMALRQDGALDPTRSFRRPQDTAKTALDLLARVAPAARARAERLGLGTRPAASNLLVGRVEEEWLEVAGGVDRTPGTLRWPIADGWFTRGYGSGLDGYHQAMDIMGDRGSEVRAAARGIVGYAGDSIRGYGNTILLVHPGGWVTMYAHNAEHFVTAGQIVERGQLIAHLGNTGISRGPHVHFEFLFAGRQCDPSRLFRPGIRHRAGNLSAIEYKSWHQPSDRPEEVRCDRRRRHPHSRYVKHASGPAAQAPRGG